MVHIYEWTMVAVLAASLAWSTPVGAEESGDLPQVATTVSGETATAPKLPASMKKKSQQKANAKPAKKKSVVRKPATPKVAPKPKAKRHALGLKGAMLPINDMNVTRTGSTAGDVRQVDYDFGIIWGWGLQYQYRLAKNFYLAGEFLYWYPQVDDTDKHPNPEASFRERDGLINIGAGLRFNVMGGEDTTDRVYLKGHVGFADYVASDGNTDNENRAGFYFNAGAGVEHMFSRTFTVFADGGYFYNSFTSPGEGEEDGSLHGIILNGGFLFHWGDK